MAGQQSEPVAVQGDPSLQVHITYNVETRAAFEKTELPLVVGILADLSGNHTCAQPKALSELQFIDIDHETFDAAFAKIHPRLSFSVKNVLEQAQSTHHISLSFNCFDDFNPKHVIDQIEALKQFNELDPQFHAQLTLILQAPELQKLEASWRGLHQLVMNTPTGRSLKVRLLDVTQQSLRLDLQKAVTLDQSALFKKVCEAEDVTYRGEPFSVLMGDFEFDRSPADIAMLSSLSAVAAAAHAPFIAAASAQLFDLHTFADLGDVNDLAATFESEEMAEWRALRGSEDARFVFLTLPRYLSRPPCNPADHSACGVEALHEHASAPGAVWGNAAWLLTQRVANAFARNRWWAETLGHDGAPVFIGPTDASISAENAQALDTLGFIALTHQPGNDGAVFTDCQSLYKPEVFSSPEANANASRFARLPYLLVASRFAHYIAVIMRSKIGSFMTRATVEAYLNTWITQYVLLDDNASLDIDATYPLREARVVVADVPEHPGSYDATVFVRPHFQLQALTGSIRLAVRISA